MFPGTGHTSRSSSRVSLLRQLGMDIFNSKFNFGTKFGQTLLLLLLLVAGFIPSSILTVQNFMNLLTTTKEYDDHVLITEKISEIGNLVYQVQIERGRNTLYLSAIKNESQQAFNEVLQQRLNVDQTLRAVSTWPPIVAGRLGTLESFHVTVQEFRRYVDISNVTYMANLEFYSNINHILIEWMEDVIYSLAPGDRWSDLNAYHLITLATEYIGIERARGTVFWNQGYFTIDEFNLFIDCELNSREFFYEAKQFSEIIKSLMTQPNIVQLLKDIDDLRITILLNYSRPSVYNATNWFQGLSKFISSMRNAQVQLASHIHSKTVEVGQHATVMTVVTAVIFLLELFIYPLYVFLACRLVFKIKHISASLAVKSGTLFKTQRRNKEMLREMYPQKIADRLVKGETVEPETFEHATVCFIVISDFDRIMTDCSGHDAVTIVKRVFEVMDDELLKYDVFKVETLEDMFLLVSGVPQRNGTDHVTEIADLCLSLRNRSRSVCLDILPEGIKLRFGVCTGPIAAGIVGIKMPRYLLFGDTVNIAARMQSTSKPQSIHLSPTSGELLSSKTGYKLEQRHGVEVKGKGIMQTFWLLEKTTFANSHRVIRKDSL